MQKKILTFSAMILLLIGIGQAQIRIIHVDPLTDQITFENKGAIQDNVGNKILCARFDYTLDDIASDVTVINGNLVLNPGETVTVKWDGFVDDIFSDIGLYTNTAFVDPNSMIDFMQYGSGGVGREGIAVMAGLWEAGDFIENPGPFTFNGNATDTGVSFWDNGTVGIFSLQELSEGIHIIGSHINQELIIENDLNDFERFEVGIVSMTGQLLKQETINQTQNQIIIDVQDLQSGLYLVRFKVDDSILVKKIIKQ